MYRPAKTYTCLVRLYVYVPPIAMVTSVCVCVTDRCRVSELGKKLPRKQHALSVTKKMLSSSRGRSAGPINEAATPGSAEMKGRGRGAAVLSQSLSLYRVPTCGIEVGWQRNLGPKGLALNSLYISLS